MKELEHELQFLSGTKHETQIHVHDANTHESSSSSSSSSSSPFAEFFNIPQYSTGITGNLENLTAPNDFSSGYQLSAAGAADIEVTMVDNHVNLKLRSKRRPKLLPRIISGIESLSLTVLHLNVTKAAAFVLCSLSLKVSFHLLNYRDPKFLIIPVEKMTMVVWFSGGRWVQTGICG